MDGTNQQAIIIYKKGQRIGQYEIVEAGMQTRLGHTYLGQRVYQNTQAMLEILQLPLLDELKEAFLAQTQTIMQLDQAYILRLRDAGLQSHYPFLVAEYGAYRTLREVCPAGNQQPLALLLAYLKQIASALQYAHSQHVLHGDIRPENIWLDRDNNVLLWGFKIEAIAQNRDRLKYQNDKIANLADAYTAPELSQGQASPASDQYALAMLVYELLCGSLPFSGSSVEIAYQQTHAPLPSLSQKVPGISPGVENVVMRGLARDPGSRFVDVSAFVSTLAQAQNGQPGSVTPRVSAPAQPTGVIALPYPLAPQTPLPPGPPPAQAPTYLAAQGTPPVGIPQPPIHLPPPGPPPTQAPTYPAAQGMQPANFSQQPVYSPPPGPPIVQLASQGVPPAAPHVVNPLAPRRGENSTMTRRVFAVGLVGLAAVGGAGGWYFLSRRLAKPAPPAPTSVGAPPPAKHTLVNNKQVLVFTGHLASVNALSWSPDGTLIASASDDTFVQVWNASSGQRTLIYSGHTEEVAAVGWAPNGKLIASGGEDQTVQVWDAATGAKSFTYTMHTDRVNAVSWSSNSQMVASGSDDKTVQTWNASTGETIFIFKGHTSGVLCVGWQPNNTSIASGSWDGTLRDWATVQHGDHFNAGDEIFSYGGHGVNEVTALAWSPNNSFIASAGADQTVQFSSGNNGAPLQPFFTDQRNNAHVNPILSVSWSPDGTSIASGDTNGDVYVWNVLSRKTFFIYKGHKGPVNAVSWSPDGTKIASASADATVQVWQPR
jgi:eukaryotic-like serine/threonine-protein kinase